MVALLALGCGVGEEASYAPTTSHAGDLRVDQVVVGKTAFVEGALSFIRIESESGEKLIEETLPNVERPTFTARLDPGTYGITSWQRACDGNCERLGEPTEECANRVRIGRRARVRATIRVSPGEGCAIVVES